MKYVEVVNEKGTVKKIPEKALMNYVALGWKEVDKNSVKNWR